MTLRACRDNLALIEKLSVPEEGKSPLQFAARFPQSHLAQYRIITHRNFISYWRNTSYNCTRFAFGILLGILFGSALWDIGQKRSPPLDHDRGSSLQLRACNMMLPCSDP